MISQKYCTEMSYYQVHKFDFLVFVSTSCAVILEVGFEMRRVSG